MIFGTMGAASRWFFPAVAFGVIGQTTAVLGLVSCAVRYRRRRRGRGLVPALVLLMVLSDGALLAVFLSFQGVTIR